MSQVWTNCSFESNLTYSSKIHLHIHVVNQNARTRQQLQEAVELIQPMKTCVLTPTSTPQSSPHVYSEVPRFPRVPCARKGHPAYTRFILFLENLDFPQERKLGFQHRERLFLMGRRLETIFRPEYAWRPL